MIGWCEATTDRVGLAGRRDAIASTLNHGDQRKLEVAILLALEPDVFMFDTLQFDGYEDELGDGDGYNFRFTINTSEWAVGGHNYVIEYRIYTTLIGVKVLQAIVRCATVYQS